MSDRELRHIAIGYDESVSMDFDDDGVDDGILDGEVDPLEAMDAIVHHLLAHAESHKACLMVIREWPPSTSGELSRMIFDLGLAMYLGKPLIIVCQAEVELPPHLRVLARSCISYTGDDPMQSTTVQAIMARYA